MRRVVALLLHLKILGFWQHIGHPRDLPGDDSKIDVADFVLMKPKSAEQSNIDQAIDKALKTLPVFIKGDVQHAMQVIHSPE